MEHTIANPFSLEGKTALVTGAGNPKGLCYAMALALNQAGAQVILMDISPAVFEVAEALGGAGNRFYAVQADLSDSESMSNGFQASLDIFEGHIDILLNGAGIQYRCDAIDFPADKWHKVIDINLNATFFMSQMAARVMIEQGGGKIINIASMTSFFGSRRIPAYSASKGAVMQLTKALSNEWCSLGINVNAIAPGYMDTELTANLINTDQGRQTTERIPAKRWGKPADLGGVTVFLASPASDYISGAIIPVDGGYLGS